MIVSFKHKGLEAYYKTGNARGIQAKHARKLKYQFAALDSAFKIEDLDIPGYKLHPLKGSRKGIWSITVNGNWRLTFRFNNGNIEILNYEDYH